MKTPLDTSFQSRRALASKLFAGLGSFEAVVTVMRKAFDLMQADYKGALVSSAKFSIEARRGNERDVDLLLGNLLRTAANHSRSQEQWDAAIEAALDWYALEQA